MLKEIFKKNIKRYLFKLHPQKFMSSQVNECTDVYWEPDIIVIGTDYNSSEAHGKIPNYTRPKKLDLAAGFIFFLFLPLE